jgi:hypothetical protein
VTEKRIVKGSELELGMTVQRLLNGSPIHHPMIIFSDGPYYKNPLYIEDDFEVLIDNAV